MMCVIREGLACDRARRWDHDGLAILDGAAQIGNPIA